MAAISEGSTENTGCSKLLDQDGQADKDEALPFANWCSCHSNSTNDQFNTNELIMVTLGGRSKQRVNLGIVQFTILIHRSREL
jgi:hypothetical protein